MRSQAKRALRVAATGSVLLSALVGTAASARLVRAASPSPRARGIRVRLQPRVIEYRPCRVSVSGIAATSVSVRLRGADDPTGLAYQWTPYRWHRLTLVRGSWRGFLSAPPLRGIYQLQFRVQQHKQLLQSPHWLLRVLPPDTLRRSALPTPRAVIRAYVRNLPGDQVLAVARRWRPATFDHRDPRLHRLFVIAYRPRDNNTSTAARGLFINTVRDGYRGRWRLLEATTAPYD